MARTRNLRAERLAESVLEPTSFRQAQRDVQYWKGHKTSAPHSPQTPSHSHQQHRATDKHTHLSAARHVKDPRHDGAQNLTPQHYKYPPGEQIPPQAREIGHCCFKRDTVCSFFLPFLLEGLQDWVSAADLMKQDS